MPFVPFVQSAPCPGNFYLGDGLLRGWLARRLPPDLRATLEPELEELGELAAGPLARLQLEDRTHEPRLVQWDAWGTRIDRIEPTTLWREAERIAVRFGLVALPYEREEHEWSRLRQFALVHLFHPVSDVYTCPLAMSDGAARTLLAAGDAALVERAVPRLTSRDPAQAWTSGQWMTESTGGSDVGRSETRARECGPPPAGVLPAAAHWRLEGKKWFTSAASSQMALTLARPEGNGSGGSGLAMFYVECRDAAGRLQGIRVERLKDKLGTRKVPTAELALDGTPAVLVGARTHGTRAIEPMLRITRTWNSVCAASSMRHGLRLAADYAARRSAFGAPLAEQPLHRATLEELEAECAAAFVLTFTLVELLGRDEAGVADEDERALLRLLTPLAKLVTGRQAVQAASETLEALGGAGYVEDTGLPLLLRDAQVLPIWEGTTNVLALDLLLRADLVRGLGALARRVARALAPGVEPQGAAAPEGALRAAGESARRRLEAATHWLRTVEDPAARQAGARRFAWTLGRALQLALLVEHARALPEGPARAHATALACRFDAGPATGGFEPAHAAAHGASSRANG